MGVKVGDAFSLNYFRFMHFREAVAEAAGFRMENPLFYHFPDHRKGLPLTPLTGHPLSIFIYSSDCGAVIPLSKLEPLINELRRIKPNLPEPYNSIDDDNDMDVNQLFLHQMMDKFIEDLDTHLHEGSDQVWS